MGRYFSQIWSVIVMNVRSLPQRLWMSLAAVFAVSVVVAVLLSFLAMVQGFQATIEGTGSEEVAIVTRSGSRAELNSTLARDTVNIVSTAPGIAKNEAGDPIYSPELFVVVDAIKKVSQTEANVPLRGIDPAGFALRDQVEITEGRMFTPGNSEIIVGEGVLREFSGFELGTQVRFGKTTWEVVGVFTTGGSAFESELWADTRTVQTQFQRGSSYQTMRIRLEESGNIDGIKNLIENDPRLVLDVETEADYFAEQAGALNNTVMIGWGIAIVMSLGALAGALNTMYTSVSSRSTEIATLRALGFNNSSAFFGTLVESIVLSLIGGIVGTVLAFTFIDGLSSSTMGANFTQVVFSFELTPELFKQGTILALIIGFVGGFFPAFQAARLPVVVAFRRGN